MTQPKEKKKYHCQFELTLDIIGGKWKPLMLFYIGMEGVIRYGGLKKCIPNINDRMLTRQLRGLENDELVKREVYREVPPKVEYSLTKLGKLIMPILKELKDWGIGYNQVMKITDFDQN